MKLLFALECFVILLRVAQAAAEPVVSDPKIYRGMCDASAAVALDADHFAVANDEDNKLRIYRKGQEGMPGQSRDLSEFLRVDPKRPESDLEGAAWLGDRIFWITSHGRNREGKFRESRHRFFATTVQKTNDDLCLRPVGKAYTGLLKNLVHDGRLKRFNLHDASKLAPKQPGALNIEGLCATPDQRLLIGFRNPIPFGRALIVPLLNPNGVIAGQPVRLGDPLLLDLGGRGVRDLAFWHGKYLLVAGSSGPQTGSQLYLWKGPGAVPELIAGLALGDFNPEAAIVYPNSPGSFQLLSDDGARLVNGVPGKELADPAAKSFRSVWITP